LFSTHDVADCSCSLQLEAVFRLAPTLVDMTFHECAVIENQEPDGLALPRFSLSIALLADFA